MLKLLALAGGFGTRLRSVVSDVPKPLAPISGRPYLAYLLETWVEQGVTDITLLLHHQADAVEAFLAEVRPLFAQCRIATVTEPQPLGTGGAVAHAVREEHIAESFIVVNADTWLGNGIAEIANAAAPCIGVIKVADAGRYGSVELDGDRITAFREKRPELGSGWINAGIYHLRPQELAGWDGKPFSVERDLFPKLAASGTLGALPLATEFIDIGVPEDYRRFCRWAEAGKKGVP